MITRGTATGAAALLAAAAMGAVAAVLAGAAAVAIQVFEPEGVHFWRLDNGLRVVVKEDHASPLVAVNVVIRAGTRLESEDNSGISHFLEHMIFRTARGGGDDLLAGPIEAVGGVVNGGTLRDFTHFHAVTASRHLELALATLAGAIMNPRFDGADVLSERLVLVRESRQLADQPQVAVWDAAFRLAYGRHPYAMPIGGTETSLMNIGEDALTDFHRLWYTPDNASVVVVGDIAPDEARAAAARAFSRWKRGESQQPALPPTEPLSSPREQLETRGVSQATALMAFRAPGMSSPREVCAADLLLTILGEGYSSRLIRALLDTKLADEVSVDFLTQKLQGLFGIRATCAPQNVGQVRCTIERELARLHSEPVGDEELAKAKRLLSHSFVFANETVEDQAATLGFYEAVATYEFAVTYLDCVRSLTCAEVQAAAHKHLDPRKEVWVRIMPCRRAKRLRGVAGEPGLDA